MTSRKPPFIALAALLACSAPAGAYQPGEVFRLDLKAALLSPQPIGPPAPFEPAPQKAVVAADTAAELPQPAAQVSRAAKAPAPRVAVRSRAAVKGPAAAVPPKLARVRRNPLDANAADTRMQVWPCRSGGICNWRK